MQKNCREIKHRAKLFYDFEFASGFLDMTGKAQETKLRNRQTETHQNLKLCTSKALSRK